MASDGKDRHVGLVDADLVSLLGSPLESKRFDALRKCRLQPDFCTPEVLLPLATSENAFLATSAVELLAQFGHGDQIPGVLARWYSRGLRPHEVAPNPKDNDVYWKDRGNAPDVLGQSLLLIRSRELSMDDPMGFIKGLAIMGQELSNRRQDVMSRWPIGLHYVAGTWSFSPLLFVRAVSELGNDWWSRAKFIRVGQENESRHAKVPALTSPEVATGAPLAWEGERFMFGYFLPLLPEIRSFGWLVSEFLYQVLYSINQRHRPLPEVALSAKSLQGYMRYQALPHMAGPFLRISNLLGGLGRTRVHISSSTMNSHVSDSYTDRLVGRLMSREPDLLGSHRRDDWGVQCAEICQEYIELESDDELGMWRRRFSTWLYALLVEDEACLDGWRDEAILRTCANDPEAGKSAWRVVDKYGVTDQDCRIFLDTSLGSLVLGRLLDAGSIDAFRLLRRLLLEDRVTPTHGICFWFRSFLRAMSGGDNYLKRIDSIRLDIGNKWEVLCRKAATVLYGQILVTPLLANGKRVDIIPNQHEIVRKGSRVLHAPIGIECKKSLRSSDEVLLGALGKYSGFVDHLEMWVLEDDDSIPEMPKDSLNGLDIVYGKRLAERVSLLDPLLADDIAMLSKRDSQEGLDAQLLEESSGALYPREVIKDILDLNDYLRPYYARLRVKTDTWRPRGVS